MLPFCPAPWPACMAPRAAPSTVAGPRDRRRPAAAAAAALLALAGLSAGGAFAQAAADATPRNATALPEVQVIDTGGATSEDTGQYNARAVSVGKMPQTLRETPQSVSVITRQQLDDRNFTKVEDAVKQTTGITVTRFDGAGNYNSFQARGFDIGTLQLDGMPIAQGNYATLDTAVYDRIEVLRGPAGLLQGAGEPGGTINLVRKRARSTLGLAANMSAGSFGLRRADVDLTGALNAAGTLRGRVVAVSEKRDGFTDTLFNDKQLGYGTLELDIGPRTTLSVGTARQRTRAAVDQGLPTYADGRLIDLPRSAFAGLRANRQNLETADTFAELEHRMDDGGMARLSVRDVDREAYYRSARSNSAMAANGAIALQTVDGLTESKNRNYDLFVTTPVVVGGRTHRLLLGASRNEGTSYEGNFGYGATLPFNLLRPDYDLAYPDIRLPGYTSTIERRENAVYGQAQIALADRLKLVAGGRTSWAEAQTRTTADGAVTGRQDPGRRFTPLMALLYDLDSRFTVYTSYVETFAVQSEIDAARQLLPPRTGKQVELGLKGALLDKRLNAHAALFRILDTGRAVADPSVPNASVAGGKVRSQGFEAEVSGQIMPGWDLLAGYAYTDTKYLRAPVAQQGQVFSAITPKHSVNLFTRYALRAPMLQGWSVGGGLSYRSEFFAQSGALRLASGNYTLLNAQVAYQVNDKVAVSLNAENLLDKTYYEKLSSPGRQNFYGEPRRLVATLRVRY